MPIAKKRIEILFFDKATTVAHYTTIRYPLQHPQKNAPLDNIVKNE